MSIEVAKLLADGVRQGAFMIGLGLIFNALLRSK
jgi:hypothetical protein